MTISSICGSSALGAVPGAVYRRGWHRARGRSPGATPTCVPFSRTRGPLRTEEECRSGGIFRGEREGERTFVLLSFVILQRKSKREAHASDWQLFAGAAGNSLLVDRSADRQDVACRNFAGRPPGQSLSRTITRLVGRPARGTWRASSGASSARDVRQIHPARSPAANAAPTVLIETPCRSAISRSVGQTTGRPSWGARPPRISRDVELSLASKVSSTRASSRR